MLETGMSQKIYMLWIVTLVFISVSSHKLISQESNYVMPIPEIEQKLQHETYEIFRLKEARYTGDIVRRCIFKWPDNSFLQVKLKPAPTGGHMTNNAPRFEMAAYQIQKLFLDYDEYVVPPTFGRSMPVDEFKKYEIQVNPTFKNTSCVFIVLQCWLENVDTEFKFDKKRFETDSVYARNLANMNILTYLIEHNDSNKGNFLISTLPDVPKVFSVDNGMAFGSRESRRGTEWRDMKVSKLPVSTVEKLRKITSATLHEKLGVVGQYQIVDGQVLPDDVSENLDAKKGVRVAGAKVQFGLTDIEIDAIDKRLQKLMKQIDDGKYTLF